MYIYFELKNISATDISSPFILKIGESEYQYSVLDYVRACLESSEVSEATKALVAATYRYNSMANAFFGD